ncbi:hypothetical protein N7478_000735 [Penicillium angulare]|uniref:uncharacterized protein n=1 Tax=Penicillium angulare TaxID=116970 RepID=UPI002540DD80|nr:uncharacterized protein N7478_000735 [Penicillium angulare]KAJ5291484.1 hypothetical protein N7478_000735 [Penicillium angulare]
MSDTRKSASLEPFPLPGRFSFSQLLLVISYVFLQRCLPAKNDDSRQLRDIIRRAEDDWTPQIGREGLIEMKRKSWQQCDQETQQVWTTLRDDMMRQNILKSSLSAEKLRHRLRCILCRIEQVSAQGLNALCTPKECLERPRISVYESLSLICRSLAVMSVSWSNDQAWSAPFDVLSHTITEILNDLRRSPLFSDGLSGPELEASLNSLSMALYCENEGADVLETRHSKPKIDIGSTTWVQASYIQKRMRFKSRYYNTGKSWHRWIEKGPGNGEATYHNARKERTRRVREELNLSRI